MGNCHRCKYNNIWVPNTRKYRCCKKTISIGNYCIVHLKLLFNDYVIKIQKIYKGFYIRKKLKIYYKLPRDLQRKIIWHINSNLYLKHYNSSISKLIYNRYNKFYKDYEDILNNYYNFYNNYNNYLIFFSNFEEQKYLYFIVELFSLINLTIKYHKILNIKKIKNQFNIKYITMFMLKYRLMDVTSIDYKSLQLFNNLY